MPPSTDHKPPSSASPDDGRRDRARLDSSESRRRELISESIVGFVGFFAFLAVVQAVINLLQPEPAVWPAVLALVLVIAAVSVWRYHRARRRVHVDEEAATEKPRDP